MVDAGNPRDVEEKVKRSRVREKEIRDMLYAVMQQPQGRMWLWDLLDQCGLFRISHTGHALNTAFNEGQRNVGLKIQVDMVNASSELFIKMLTENQNG